MRGQVIVKGGKIAVQSDGAGPPLLLISGLGYGAWFWDWLRPHLFGFHTVTFDYRGIGDSDPPKGPFGTSDLANDALGVLHALNLSHAHILGHSLGGMVAQQLALTAPNTVDRLVLVSTAHGGPKTVPTTPEALDAMLNHEGDLGDVLRRGIGVATAKGFLDEHPDIYNQILAKRLCTPVPPDVYDLQVQAGAAHDTEARLGEIRPRTLVLTGADDRVVPPANAELLGKKIPKAEVKIIPGAGHLLPIEMPREMGLIVQRFLTRM